ncbi:WhiB family transcriptional regulator [Rhodococcus sp. NPDC003318]|uniref:WhiB family transcriptional regulator n=1 Tax=Rhodococcus sp. NPDC003318 TaxID=3364503 RepID=UPI00368B7893
MQTEPGGSEANRRRDRESWYRHPDRHCVSTPEKWWFPESRASRETTERIATLCVNCPVRAQCAYDARACDDRYGIRAGVDLSHLADPYRTQTLDRIATSPTPEEEPIVLGRGSFRRTPVELEHRARNAAG